MSSQPNTNDSQSLTAFISIGANEPSWAGSERETIEAALPYLQELSSEPLKLSNFYITDPVDCEPGTKDFVNAAVKLMLPSTQLPLGLLEKLQDIEARFGRQRKNSDSVIRNAARPLDLDLIYFGGNKLTTARLVLPHPRAAERRFVLVPLADLCCELDIGGSTKVIAELIKNLPQSPGLRKYYP